MSTTALATLIQPLTKDQLGQLVRTGCLNQGLPVSDWRATSDGGIENGLIDTFMGTIAALGGQQLADAIAGGFLGLAPTQWLRYLASSFYRVEYQQATYTIQKVTLTCAAGAGPYTINAGDLTVAGASGNRYVNTDGGVLKPGAVLKLNFQAEKPGSAYNDAPNTISVLSTSLPGVTALNARVMSPVPAALMTGGVSRGTISPYDAPGVSYDRFRLQVVASGQAVPGTAQFSLSVDDGVTWSTPVSAAPSFSFFGLVAPVSGGLLPLLPGLFVFVANAAVANPSFYVGDVFFWANTPIVQQGSDEESDARLAARCRAKWFTLSDVETPGTVELWVKTASPEVTRVKVVSDPNRANGMLIYVGSSSGTVGPNTLVAIQKYVSARVDPSGEQASVLSVALRAIFVFGGVLAPRATLADVQERAEANWNAYLGSLGIGSTVRLAKLEQALMDAGAIDFSSLVVAGGSPDLVVGPFEVPVQAPSLTLATLLSWEAV